MNNLIQKSFLNHTVNVLDQSLVSGRKVAAIFIIFAIAICGNSIRSEAQSNKPAEKQNQAPLANPVNPSVKNKPSVNTQSTSVVPQSIPATVANTTNSSGQSAVPIKATTVVTDKSQVLQVSTSAQTTADPASNQLAQQGTAAKPVNASVQIKNVTAVQAAQKNENPGSNVKLKDAPTPAIQAPADKKEALPAYAIPASALDESSTPHN